MTSTIRVTSAGPAPTGTTTNLMSGLSKAWVNFDGKTSGGVTNRDSFNVSGLVDNGTGDYNATLTNNMGNANYSQVASSHNSGVSWSLSPYTGGKTASALDIQTGNDGGVAADTDIIDTIACGDLA